MLSVTSPCRITSMGVASTEKRKQRDRLVGVLIKSQYSGILYLIPFLVNSVDFSLIWSRHRPALFGNALISGVVVLEC